MRVDGTANITINIKPVQAEGVQVQSHVEEVKPIEKIVDDRQREGISTTDIVNQIISARKGDMPISEKILVEAIDRANKAIVGSKREFEYKKHDILNAFTVKVINSETKEVVREIPPERILDLVANLMELAGVLVDEKR